MQDLQMLQDAATKGDETRPRGCKNTTPTCALAKILPETTVLALGNNCRKKIISVLFHKLSLPNRHQLLLLFNVINAPFSAALIPLL